MSLPITYILGSLKNSYELTASIFEDRNVNCLLICDDDTKKLRTGPIYICTDEDFRTLSGKESDPVDFLIVSRGIYEYERRPGDRRNVICLQHIHNVKGVINDVQYLFEEKLRLAEASDMLVHSLSSKANVEETVELMSIAFENPVMLLDTSLRMITSYEGEGNIFDETWQNIKENGYAPESAFSFFNTHNTMPKPWYGQEGRKRIICIRIRSQNEAMTIGFAIILEYNRPFSKNDQELVSTAATVMAVCLEKKYYHGIPPESAMDAFVKNMLMNVPYEPYELMARIKRFNWTIQRGYIVRVMTEEIYDYKNEASRIIKELKDIYPDSYILIFREYIVIIAPIEENNYRAPDHRKYEQLEKLLTDNNLTAGVSDCFNSPSQIGHSYNQTRIAISIGMSLDDPGPIYLYRDYVLHHILDCASPNMPLETLCDPLLLDILNYDKEKGTAYTYTLFMYLKNCQDIKNAARAMNVHYNTLKYRLSRMEEMFGISLKDGERLFDLWLSFRIIEYLKKWNYEKGKASSAFAEDTAL